MDLDPVQVSAVATVVLAVITLAYVVATGFIARSSARSAKAAEEAAASSERAARAAERASKVGEAALEVAFEVDYMPNDTTHRPLLNLKCTGATVFIHGLRLTHAFGIPLQKEDLGEDGERGWTVVDGTPFDCSPLLGEVLPKRVHRGESTVFSWPAPEIDYREAGWGLLAVMYSIAADESPRPRQVPLSFTVRRALAEFEAEDSSLS